jgi:hypothetical protein
MINKITIRRNKINDLSLGYLLVNSLFDINLIKGNFPNFDDSEKSRIIEKIILKLPLQKFIGIEQEDNTVDIQDAHVLIVIKEFMEGKFPLSKLKFLENYQELYFHQLPSTFQRQMNIFPLEIDIFDKKTPKEVINFFYNTNKF